MKKVIILEERDYKKIMNELERAKEVLTRMRRTQNRGYVEYHIDNALHWLTGEDSSLKDLRNSIPTIDY